MNAARKFSSCIDCSTPIIGERLRCSACHDQHSEIVLKSVLPDQDRPLTLGEALLTWFVAVQFLAIAAILFLLLIKSC